MRSVHRVLIVSIVLAVAFLTSLLAAQGGSSQLEQAVKVSATQAQQNGRVFVSSNAVEGDMSDFTTGDVLCQSRADIAGLGGTWLAWLSTTTIEAPDRLPDRPYERVDGALVVDSVAGLTNDSDLANPIILDENGSSVGSVHVWTGTFANGTAGGNLCDNWTDRTREGGYGITDASNGEWTDVGAEFCTALNHLYCFEVSVSAPPPPPPPPPPPVPSLPGPAWPLIGLLALVSVGLLALWRMP